MPYIVTVIRAVLLFGGGDAVAVDHRADHAVGPAEAVLHGIFAAAAGAGLLDIVFLDHLAGAAVKGIDGLYPAAGDRPGEAVGAVAVEPGDGDPLQRRPAIGGIPLLAGAVERGAQPAGGEQPGLGRA